MDGEKLVAAIERFFLDIIGCLLPGAFLLVGLGIGLGGVGVGPLSARGPSDTAAWLLWLSGSYVLGHAVVSAGERFVRPGGVRLAAGLRRIPVLRVLVSSNMISEEAMWQTIANRAATNQFLHHVTSPATEDRHLASKVRDWRNTAMTISRPEDRATAVRLRFLSQLNLGIATDVWAVALVLCGARLVATMQAMGGILSADVARAAIQGAGLILVAIAFSLLFLERDARFLLSSLRLPFDAALGAIRQGAMTALPGRAEAAVTSADPKPKDLEDAAPSSKSLGSRRIAVYLAGGLHSGWQDRTRAAVPEATYFDPRTHGLSEPSAFTSWDLDAIKRSDVVFAYLEESNPGGYALALEVGFARALGKHVVLVDERSTSDPSIAPYLTMVHESADVHTPSIEEGMRYLRHYVEAKYFSPNGVQGTAAL